MSSTRRFPAQRARVVLLAALALTGCAGGPREGEGKPVAGARRELTAEELRDLLSKGTIRPVVEMEGDDPFAQVDTRMDPAVDPGADPTQAGAQAPGGSAARPPEESGAGVTTPPSLPPSSAPSADSATTGAPAAHAAPTVAVEPPVNPYLQFGARIKVYPDGTITKPFPLRVGTGTRLQKLLVDYGNFPLWTPEMGAGPSTPTTVKLDLLEKWDVELYQDLRNAAVAAGAEQPLADWLVVTAGADLLQEVEDFINLFAAGVPQIEIEAKIVEISLTDVLDIGVRAPDGVPMFQFPSKTFVKSFDSSMPNVADGIEGLLTLGGVQDAVTFNAVLEALAVNDNVSIISRPKIAVREGGRADITNTTKIPFLNVGGINNAGGYNATVAFQEVGVKMFVVPRVVGTQTVALNIDVEQSQQTGNETVLVAADNSQVQVPVLSTRSARTVVYLQPGQAVILGGLITERTVETERKVPFLGDIPVIRHLFRSQFSRKEQTNVLFFIRPRILQGSDLNRQF
jgi:type II secretory pathway component GspD/PulD (secretin)